MSLTPCYSWNKIRIDHKIVALLHPIGHELDVTTWKTKEHDTNHLVSKG